MSFETNAILGGGMQASLYEIYISDDKTFFLTNFSNGVESSGRKYYHEYIYDSGISHGGNLDKANVTVSFPFDSEESQYISKNDVSYSSRVVIKSVDITDPDNAKVSFSGVIASRSVKDGIMSLDVEPTIRSISQIGLTLRYEKECPYTLYDVGCFLDKNLFKEVVSVDSISNNVATILSVDSSKNGIYDGGYIEQGSDRNMILKNTSGQFILSGRVVIKTGQATIYQGCRHNLIACDEKSNVENYGGLPYFMFKNPFSTKAF